MIVVVKYSSKLDLFVDNEGRVIVKHYTRYIDALEGT